MGSKFCPTQIEMQPHIASYINSNEIKIETEWTRDKEVWREKERSTSAGFDGVDLEKQDEDAGEMGHVTR